MLLTRRELAPFLSQKGFKTSIHKLNRLCSPAINEGPPVAGRWGAADLYHPEAAVQWAEARSLAAMERPRYAIAPEHIARRGATQSEPQSA